MDPNRREALSLRAIVAALASCLGLCVALAASPSIARAQDVPIAYVRCARTTASYTTSSGRMLRGLDIYDVLPDVTHFFSGFSAPCDLVLRETDGTERVLYDCSSSSTDDASCAAMDPVVSFDGATIAFSVFRGPLERLVDQISTTVGGDDGFHALPNRVIAATGAQLHLVDVATGAVTALPHVEGVFDSGPAWLPDGRIAFTSTRDGNRGPIVWSAGGAGRGARIWTSDADGRNLDLASHHALAMDQHPIVLRDGRVALSSWQIFGGQAFRYNSGSAGGFTTLENLFHIYTQHPDGANQFAFFGQHCGDHEPISSVRAGHQAAHFLAQSSDGRVWFADYYRGNNSGLGMVLGVMPEPEGQEGILPTESTPVGDYYAPRDIVSIATWASSADFFAAPMAAPELRLPGYADPILFAGKLGHPAPLPDAGMMVTWGKGACSTVATYDVFEHLGRPIPPGTSGSGGGFAANVLTELGLDTPACDAGIYRVTRIPSTHPSDLAPIVDDPAWHEIMPRAVVPYARIHGIERPTAIPRADLATSRSDLPVGTPFGILGAASILDRETRPAGGIHFGGSEHQFHLQGTDTIEYGDDDLCGVRILGVLPNRASDTPSEGLANIAGERVIILGEIPVRNRDESGAAILDPSGSPDTSFLVRFPANTPYLMQGIDCDGRTLSTDQTWQSLRPGETKTCGGCHVHSRPARVDFDATFAARADYAVTRLGEGEVPLLAGGDAPSIRRVAGYGMQIDFARDIAPIFERRCASCHGGSAPAAALALDRPGTEEGSTWFCLVADLTQTCVPPDRRMESAYGTVFRRPQLTRYVRAFASLASLLYWKAAGLRTDGRTDATYDDTSPLEDRDVDFGAPHETEITPEELGLLSRWIDIGSPGGEGELRDTQRPTLTLSALLAGDSVTALRVGMVDVPSGIDPASLEVCVLDASGACGANLASSGGAMHDVVEVALATPLTDPEIEVRARVRDVAGNETEVRRTVRALLGSTPPPPPPIDGGPGGARLDGGVRRDGAIDPGPAVTGSCGCAIAGRPSRSTPSALASLAALAIALSVRSRRGARRSLSNHSRTDMRARRQCAIPMLTVMTMILSSCTDRPPAGTDDAGTTAIDASPRTDARTASADARVPATDSGPRSGPLASLPSANGAHIAEIEALAPNEWISLGAPAADPTFGRARGRSWGGRAFVLAPEIRAAYFTGEGVHAFVKPDGYAMDDIWAYDIPAHRWIAVHPGTHTLDFNRQVRDGELRIDDNGQVVDRSDQPIPIHLLIHAWGYLSYDTRAHRFAFLGGDLAGGHGLNRYYLGGAEEMDEGLDTLESMREGITIPPMSPWFYDTTSGRFDRYPLASSSEAPHVGDFPFFQYLESTNRYLLAGSSGVAFYDPTTNQWAVASDTGTRPPGYDHGGGYDPMRERIYMGPGDGELEPTDFLYVYDIATSAWSSTAGTGSPFGAGSNGASVVYDTANDVITVLHYARREVMIYAPATDTWETLPFPEGVLAGEYHSENGFYDPALNAYFVYQAVDSEDDGVMWAYRYR
jgi:hypothetical protein